MNFDEDSFRGSPKTNGQLLRRHILGGVAFLRKFNDMKFIPKDNWGELIHLRFLGWATSDCATDLRDVLTQGLKSTGPGLLFRPNFFCVDANLHIIVSWPAEKRAMKKSRGKVARTALSHSWIMIISDKYIYIYCISINIYIYVYYIPQLYLYIHIKGSICWTSKGEMCVNGTLFSSFGDGDEWGTNNDMTGMYPALNMICL
jgi:hypothetical protein